MTIQRPATFEHTHDSSFEYTCSYESRKGRESSRRGESRPVVQFGICDGLLFEGSKSSCSVAWEQAWRIMFRDWQSCLFGRLAAFEKGGKTKAADL